MKNQKLLDRYPWYSHHFKATNLMARFLGLEVRSTLEIFDKQIRKNNISK